MVKGAMLIGKHLKMTAPLWWGYVWRKNEVRRRQRLTQLCNAITLTCRKLIK